MVRPGGVHDNLIVNVRARGAAMVAYIAGAEAFARFGSVKRAVLALKGVDPTATDGRLTSAGGVLRWALNQEEHAR
jgi:hypothetical protein